MSVTYEFLEQHVARWVTGAVTVADAVMIFLRRFLPAVAADVDQAVAKGGRLRIVIDLEAGAISRFRVRLLRSEMDSYSNRTVYDWRPPSDDRPG